MRCILPPMPEAHDSYVIVHRSYDPIEAELLGELLRDAGVRARVTGTRSGAMIGVGQNILEVQIAVPSEQAGQATDFLEAYFSDEAIASAADALDGANAAEDDEHDGDDDQAEAVADRPVRPLLAAGSAFLTFGVGHFYARRPVTGMALLVGQLVAMRFLFAGHGWRDWTVGLVALGGVVLFDLVGSVLAARAHGRGVRRGHALQAGLGALYVAASIGVAVLVGPHLTDPKAGDPTGGWRRVQHRDPLQTVDRPLENDPSFPPLTSEHPANPAARRRP